MRIAILISLLAIWMPQFVSAQVFDLDQSRCQPPTKDEPKLYKNDFFWNMSLLQMEQKFAEIYESGKRLQRRAYYDQQKGAYVVQLGNGQMMRLPERLIVSVQKHIEEALERQYAQYVMFPDMGHSHFFIPMDFYERVLRPIPADDKAQTYETMLAHEGLKVLYHTAEQLKMTDDEQNLLADPFLQWRYYTRNPVGGNEQLRHLEIHKDLDGYNTVRDYKGYRYWGAGFSISASKNGCFSYEHEGKTFYFDLSMIDLQPAPGSGTIFD